MSPGPDDEPLRAPLGPDPGELERALLGGERRYTRLEVAALSGVDLARTQELWRALGFAHLSDDVRAFTDRDVWASTAVRRLGEQGLLNEAQLVAMARALGQSLGRLADWQLAVIGSSLDLETAADTALERTEKLVPVFEELIGYVWRRHLAAAAGRALAAEREDFIARTMSVGFADVVGFTTLTRELEEVALGELVERFESAAADIIATAGARLVKSIGDEVLFTADSVATAAEVGLQLSEVLPTLPGVPDVRVGLATGTVLSRLGDVYGEPVNLASRLTSIARPGSVLVDREFAAALEGDDRWRLRRVPPRPVRGYTLLHPTRLRRAQPTGPGAGAESDG